jgi:uncharacterized protein YrrD
MDIPIKATVHCSDGSGGHVDRVIIDPVAKKITHIVVHEPMLIGVDVIVPVENIVSSTPKEVSLNLTRQELAGMPAYVDAAYAAAAEMGMVGGEWMAYPSGAAMAWPYATLDDPEHPPIESSIPKGELALRRGDAVEATDGHVGRIDEFLIDPKTDAITHLVLKKGHLWRERVITVPVSAIDRVETGMVQLKLSRQEIEALPSVKA